MAPQMGDPDPRAPRSVREGRAGGASVLSLHGVEFGDHESASRDVFLEVHQQLGDPATRRGVVERPDPDRPIGVRCREGAQESGPACGPQCAQAPAQVLLDREPSLAVHIRPLTPWVGGRKHRGWCTAVEGW